MLGSTDSAVALFESSPVWALSNRPTVSKVARSMIAQSRPEHNGSRFGEAACRVAARIGQGWNVT